MLLMSFLHQTNGTCRSFKIAVLGQAAQVNPRLCCLGPQQQIGAHSQKNVGCRHGVMNTYSTQKPQNLVSVPYFKAS